MPTVLTHALVGGSLVLAAPPRLRRTSVVLALAAAAVLPDADVVAFALGIPYADPLGHRGLSHSLPFAVAIAACVGLTSVGRDVEFRRHRLGLAALVFVATASHGLLDTLTDGGLGVGLWLPFEAGRYFAPWRPIAVSPIGLSGLGSGRLLTVLGSELVYVGLPVAALAVVTLALRRARPAPRSTGGEGA